MPRKSVTNLENFNRKQTKIDRFVEKHFSDQNFRSSFTAEGYAKFKTFFGTVLKGQPKVFTAPFAGDTPIHQVMREWSDVLVSIKNMWPSLWMFENDLASKVGPLSVQLPLYQRLGDIMNYYEDIKLPSEPLDDRAIRAVLKEFSEIRGLRLRNIDDTLKLMKLSSNSGSPFWSKRRDVVHDTAPCATYTYKGRHPDANQVLPKWHGHAPAVVGWRGQEGGPTKEDVKQRVIWMFPFAVNINELQVYQPLIEACQRFNLVPAWVSMDRVDLEVTNLFDTKGSDDLIVCTDFSRFDQHFNPDLQDAAETILAGILADRICERDWLIDVFPAKYYINLVWQSYTGNSSFTDISVFEGRHGMASGSGGTNADETLVHRALQYEAAQRKGQLLNTHSMCLGDDGILSYPGITIEDVVACYSSHGQEMNRSKQYATTQDCVFLRRWHHQEYRKNGICVGVYSTMRAIGRLRFLERYMDPSVWSPRMVALRQLSIIENCKFHPLKEQFVQFCMERDKFRLGKDIPGFLDNIDKEAKEAIDYMPDFLGYTKTMQGAAKDGISEWWVVKYLKSL